MPGEVPDRTAIFEMLTNYSLVQCHNDSGFFIVDAATDETNLQVGFSNGSIHMSINAEVLVDKDTEILGR